MHKLSEILSGHTCTIVWMLGSLGKFIKQMCQFEEEDELYVIHNHKEGGMIIASHGRRYALDFDSANVLIVRN